MTNVQRPQFIITYNYGEEECTTSKSEAGQAITFINGLEPSKKVVSIHKFQGGKVTEVYPVIYKGAITLKEEPYVIAPPHPEPAKELISGYREEIQRTMNKDLGEKEALAMLALGLAGEVGELVDMIKKYSYHGHEFDKTEAIKEMGDIYWYIHNLMNEMSISHKLVIDMNIAKLQKRYPKGFSEEASQRRVDTMEGMNKALSSTEKYFLDSATEYSQHKKDNGMNGNKPL